MKIGARSNHSAFGAASVNGYTYHQFHSRDATKWKFEKASPQPSVHSSGDSLAFIAVKAENLSKVIGSLRSALPPGSQIFVSESCEKSAPASEDSGVSVSSSRQLQILALLQEDLSNKEIGRLLNISHFTVRNQISQLLRIFSVSSRKDVVRILNQIECWLPACQTCRPSTKGERIMILPTKILRDSKGNAHHSYFFRTAKMPMYPYI